MGSGVSSTIFKRGKSNGGQNIKQEEVLAVHLIVVFLFSLFLKFQLQLYFRIITEMMQLLCQLIGRMFVHYLWILRLVLVLHHEVKKNGKK